MRISQQSHHTVLYRRNALLSSIVPTLLCSPPQRVPPVSLLGPSCPPSPPALVSSLPLPPPFCLLGDQLCDRSEDPWYPSFKSPLGTASTSATCETPSSSTLLDLNMALPTHHGEEKGGAGHMWGWGLGGRGRAVYTELTLKTACYNAPLGGGRGVVAAFRTHCCSDENPSSHLPSPPTLVS